MIAHVTASILEEGTYGLPSRRLQQPGAMIQVAHCPRESYTNTCRLPQGKLQKHKPSEVIDTSQEVACLRVREST